MAKHSKSKRTTTSRNTRSKATAPVSDATARRPRAAATRTSELSDREESTADEADSDADSTNAHESDPENPPESESDPDDPEFDPNATSKVPKPVPETLQKLQKRALDACQQLANAIAGGCDVGKGITALETIQRFLAKQEQAMGFSSVQTRHLRELGVREGRIVLNYEALREASRSISDRFSKDDEYLDLSGLSHKERMSEFIGLNYFLESMFNPGGGDRFCNKQKQAKMSPEFRFDEATITNGQTRRTFYGFADLVTFIVDTKFKYHEKEVRSIKKLFKHPGMNEGTLVTTEFKSPEMAFLDAHVAEGVSQAMAACTHSKRKIQRFILTDGKRWRFCIYENSENAYHMSDIVDVEKEGKEVILTLLDEWIWEPLQFSSSRQFWSLDEKPPKPL